MTLNELITITRNKTALGHAQVCLVITRKTPPKHDYITVKGMGKGYVVNVMERNGAIDVVAYFKVKDIERYIGKICQLT